MSNEQANITVHPQTWLMALTLPILMLVAYAILAATDSRNLVFILLNDWMHEAPVWLWANINFLADAAAVFALAGLCLIRKERMVYAAIVGGIACAIAIRILKIYFDEPRPPAVLNGSLFEVIGEAYRSKSFPSGHAATAMFVSGLIVAFWRTPGVYILAITFGVLGSLSRVAAGVHWPTDILVGGAIGWFIGYSTGRILQSQALFGYGKRWFVFSLSYVAAVYLLIYDPNMPYVIWLQALFAAVGLYGSMHYLAFRILKV